MPVQWNTQKISESFSRAAIGEWAWSEALDVISEEASGAGATLVRLKGGLPQLPTTPSFQEAIDTYIRDGWANHDVRFRGVGHMMRHGVATDLDFISDDEIKRNPYYQDWLARFGLKWFAGVKIAGLEELWVLSLQRREDTLPFDEEERQCLVDLARGFGNDAVLASAFGFVRADEALAAFDASRKAAFVLDYAGVVAQHNQAADSLLGGAITLRERRLSCRDERSDERLGVAVGKALLPPTRSSYVSIERPDDFPLVAHVLPVQGAMHDIFSPCQAIVIVSDPTARAAPSTLALQAIFGLTHAEAKVASKLAAGWDLRAVSDELGTSVRASRSHLRSVFQKTGFRSQPGLVAALLELMMTEH